MMIVKKAMYKVRLFGRFPAMNEVGGVTSFTYNFSKIYKDIIDVVIDFYPGKRKQIPDGVRSMLLDGTMFSRICKLITIQFSGSKIIYHYNFSTVKGLYLFLMLPKKRHIKWVVMLHNGDLMEEYNKLNVINKFIIRCAFFRIDAIASISMKQDCFYSLVTNKPVFKVVPYIPVNKGFIKSPVNKIKSNINILISGFPTSIYCHSEVLDVLMKLYKEDCLFNLNVCLYGFDNDNLQSSLLQQVSEAGFANVFMHLDMNEFNVILENSDLYIRMNSVDSFGLVVAEAIDIGLDVIASDVCERYPGAFLIGCNDFDKLEETIRKYLVTGTLENLLPSSNSLTRSNIDFLEMYDSVWSWKSGS